MKVLILILALRQLISVAYASEKINPFTSDGCSHWLEGPRSNPNLWRECCFFHDISHWMGGPKSERLDADKKLSSSVKSKGEDLNSFLMYAGVRIGGSPFRNTSYRWGHGWPSKRGYKTLTSEEIINVHQELDLTHFSENEKEWYEEYISSKKI